MSATKNKQKKTRIVINVSGEIFETYDSTLARFPNSLLGNKRKRLQYFYYDHYFFERNRLCFESILHFYQSNGTLNCPMGVSIDLFEQECSFFQLPKKSIDNMKRREGIFPELLEPVTTIKDRNPSFRKRLWDLLENPNSSNGAWVFGLFSMGVVVGSILTASLETMKTFDGSSETWTTLELVINIWFLFEFLLRMICSENIPTFLKGFMNVVDLMAILPYFVIIILQSKTVGNLLQFFKTLKFLRVCRLFRFSKHSKRLTVAGKIIQSCLGSFRLLLTCFAIVVVFGGAVLLNLEETGSGTLYFLLFCTYNLFSK